MRLAGCSCGRDVVVFGHEEDCVHGGWVMNREPCPVTPGVTFGYGSLSAVGHGV